MRFVLFVLALALPAYGAEPPAPKANEPMAGNMKKPGMKQGDVKKSAEKKKKTMQPILKKESESMPH